MKLLSRAELLQMSDEEVVGVAECHGLDVANKRAADLIDELHDFITDFAEMFGEAEG
jgi:hypothetical protein